MVFAGGEKKTVALKWKEVPEADFYKVRILDAATNKVLKEQAEVAARSLDIGLQELADVSASVQKFNVQVQAFAKEKEDAPAKKKRGRGIEFFRAAGKAFEAAGSGKQRARRRA